MMFTKSRKAFTLTEIIVVIAILGLIMAFVYPDLQKMMQSRRLESSADGLRSLLIMCRSRAMQDGIKYRVQFPGTPDPLDKEADKETDVPTETQQPEVYRQDRPIDFPDSFVPVDEDWAKRPVLYNGKDVLFGNQLRSGVRCVALRSGPPSFDNVGGSPIAGPPITDEGKTEFVPLTFNPDGTCDTVTFYLTDLPQDAELTESDMLRIYHVVVDGRTGQAWFQRALLNEEVEVLTEHEASPLLHMDFISPDKITEANIIMLGPSPTEQAAIAQQQAAAKKSQEKGASQ